MFFSDVFESVVGAILVDSNYNYERTVSMVEFVMQDVLDALTPSLRRDPISDLMEWAGISGCISSKHIVFKFVRDVSLFLCISHSLVQKSSSVAERRTI
jgi:dsRNA-specific ribonuclease